MAANAKVPVLIIKKKIKGHGGHHGGAWKVAYADFVTAMMALFIVLWLTSSTSRKEQQDIAGYFKDPRGTATQKGSDTNGVEHNLDLRPQDMSKLKEALLRSVHRVNNLKSLEKQVEMTLTPEGLRIELMETKDGTFFETGSSQPTPALTTILTVLSKQLGELKNPVSIEGHTDSQPYLKTAVYSNWELSTDRANVARRLMQANGLGPTQVAQVRGFADQRLRKPNNPKDPSNRRISLVVGYPEAAGTEQATSAIAPAPKDGKVEAPAASSGAPAGKQVPPAKG